VQGERFYTNNREEYLERHDALHRGRKLIGRSRECYVSLLRQDNERRQGPIGCAEGVL
jgi:hypothetical protein